MEMAWLWLLAGLVGPGLGADVSLHVGALFPLSADKGGWAGGQACLPAAQMALEDVNASPDVLPGFQLVMHHFDSECQPGLGGKHLYDLLYTEPTKIVLLSGCSLVTTLIAETAHLWNLVVVSALPISHLHLPQRRRKNGCSYPMGPPRRLSPIASASPPSSAPTPPPPFTTLHGQFLRRIGFDGAWHL